MPVIHPELGDNLAFKLELNSGDADAAFKEADAVLTRDLHHGATHRRDARGAGHPCRLRSLGAAAHRVSLLPGAQHDAGHPGAAPGAARARRPRHLQGRGWELRDQGAHLSRRDGDVRAQRDAGPPRQVHRRPPRVVRQRHPRARASGEGGAGCEARRDYPGHAGGRSRGHRALLGLSAHERRRRQPDRAPHAGRLSLPRLCRAAFVSSSRTRRPCASTAPWATPSPSR